jgi:hypothetical protein
MLKLPKEVVNCVGFIGSRGLRGVVLRGTAFLLTRPIQSMRDRQAYITFFVTARHVLDGIRRSGHPGCIRLTTKQQIPPTEDGSSVEWSYGVEWVDFNLDDWIPHPDQTVDAAVLKVPPDFELFDLSPVYSTMALTEDVIQKEAVGPGTEVFATGLFVNHPGQHRNLPIVRVGNIAAMPDEKVYLKTIGAEADIYLIEARSIGGLSGSPVFAHLGMVKVENQKVILANKEPGVFYWMGLIHGHYDGPLAESDEALEDQASTQERVNMGIAIVVPATRILEIFEDPSLKEFENLIANLAKEQLAPRSQTE